MNTNEAIQKIKRVKGLYAYESDYEALDMAIAALEKQEQVNTQSVNLTHTTYPNALESLKILESAKDENGCVPMSLVRLAFRNVLEQDRWIPVTERMPEIKHHIDDEHFSDEVLVTEWFNGFKKTRIGNFDTRTGWWNDEKGCGFLGVITSWRPLPEPYTEEEV